jgi:D-alanyl-D-alanine dipeptidase
MTAMNNDEAARRAYWAEQMEQGYAIVQKLIEFPVNECGERFASIPDAAADANVEMQFSTSKIAGDLDRVYFLRESLVRDVITIGREMNERGWILKIEDGFRSLDMQRQLVRKPSVFDTVLKKTIWELGGQIPTPEMMFRRAIVLTANMPKIGAHMSGSAIDISVFRRDDGTEVWRGYPYLEMSEAHAHALALRRARACRHTPGDLRDDGEARLHPFPLRVLALRQRRRRDAHPHRQSRALPLRPRELEPADQ